MSATRDILTGYYGAENFDDQLATRSAAEIARAETIELRSHNLVSAWRGGSLNSQKLERLIGEIELALKL